MRDIFLKKMKALSISKKTKIIVGVSGGVDSMVLIHLLNYFNFSFAIAHCNFSLRGNESDNDELLVSQVASDMNVSYYLKQFDTSLYAKKNKISIQMAARDLRYAWFEEIRQENSYSVIATAHHHNDSVETALINLIRGTGISGLHGIKSREGLVRRPMIDLYKDQISEFARENNIIYRDDSSNMDDKYVRNNIRNTIIPLMEEINPSVVQSIGSTINKLANVEALYRELLVEKKPQLISQDKEGYRINIDKLIRQKYPKQLLYELISSFGFGDIDAVFNSLKSGSGKEFFSEDFYMIKDREYLIIAKHILDDVITIDSNIVNVLKPFSIKFITLFIDNIKEFEILSDNKVQYIDYDKLEFPLIIRPFKHGDRFIPLGMKTTKKISDYFIDNKFSLIQKKTTRLLVSNNNIVCIIGHRLDDRFKLVEKTKKVYIVNS